MRNLFAILIIASPLTLLPAIGSAKGCLLGAAAGCVIEHHREKAKDKAAAQSRHAMPRNNAPAGNAPAATSPAANTPAANTPADT